MYIYGERKYDFFAAVAALGFGCVLIQNVCATPNGGYMRKQ